MKKRSRNAIALLMSIVFVMLIAVTIGIGLKSFYQAKQNIAEEKLLYQSDVLVSDVLKILKNTKEIDAIVKSKDGSALYGFISSMQTVPIPFEGYDVFMSVQSARDRFNLNGLKKDQKHFDFKRIEILKSFFIKYGISDELVALIMDSMGGEKLDRSYYSDLFETQKELFRDYLASYRHLEKILIFYEKKHHDNVFSKLEFDRMFSYNPNIGTRIDLNFATQQTWELLTGCTKEQAQVLVAKAGMYKTLEDILLQPSMKERLKNFNISFFEPIITVNIKIKDQYTTGLITFEYDLRTKKASHFVYKI
ncbi:MAG: hypothetical protein GXO11_03795 [Epsilonproteobacteria bacterium]|nr:hypothetical protein [Campylobacterota bacterium]